jgi:hypothetical protein
MASADKNALRDALASRDPYRVADALDLPPLSASQGRSPREHKETLQDIDGTDWSSVLSFWLDACDAASKVRHLCIYNHSTNVIVCYSPQYMYIDLGSCHRDI